MPQAHAIRCHAAAYRSNTELMNDYQNAIARAIRAEREGKRMWHRACAGVCPCCNRIFQNLARHMANRHGGKR